MSDPRSLISAPDTKWADGLRGIAALCVVISHLVLGYADWLTASSNGPDIKPAFYNFPFIRAPFEGWPWVCFFLVLTGFVNSIKPIKQARAGRADGALSGLASSCFRRTSRLVLPCTIATFFSWVLCEAGAFALGSKGPGHWMRESSPPPSGSVMGSLYTLAISIYDTWARYSNYVDRNQWAMLWFLKGSLALYVALLATSKALSKYRMIIFGCLFVYSWESYDTLMGLPIYGGALLAELSMVPMIIRFSTNPRLALQIIPFLIVLLGWFLISYPKLNPEWQPWSDALWRIGGVLFPRGSDVYVFWGVVGVLFITAGVILSSTLQRWLSSPVLLWLGAQSFPIYLIHGSLLRSLLNWMLYIGTLPVIYDVPDGNGNEVPVERYVTAPVWKFVLVLPIFFVTLLTLAWVWTLTIEPYCASITAWLESTVCGAPDEPAYTAIALPDEFEMDFQTAKESSVTFHEDRGTSLLPI